MLMNALVATGLLLKEAGVFRNSPVAARFYAQGSPNDARAAAMHTVNLWPRWSTLTDCVRLVVLSFDTLRVGVSVVVRLIAVLVVYDLDNR